MDATEAISKIALLLAGVFPSLRHRRPFAVERLSPVARTTGILFMWRPKSCAAVGRVGHGRSTVKTLEKMFRLLAAEWHPRLISSSAPTSLSLPPRPRCRWNRWQNDVIHSWRNNTPNDIIMQMSLSVNYSIITMQLFYILWSLGTIDSFICNLMVKCPVSVLKDQIFQQPFAQYIPKTFNKSILRRLFAIERLACGFRFAIFIALTVISRSHFRITFKKKHQYLLIWMFQIIYEQKHPQKIAQIFC